MLPILIRWVFVWIQITIGTCLPTGPSCAIMPPFHLLEPSSIHRFSLSSSKVHITRYIWAKLKTPRSPLVFSLLFAVFVYVPVFAIGHRHRLKRAPKGRKRAGGQQMPRVTRGPMGSQLSKPANKHSKQTPANILSQMRTLSQHTPTVIYIPCKPNWALLHIGGWLGVLSFLSLPFTFLPF